MHMTDKEKDLIIKLASKKITVDEFEKHFLHPHDSTAVLDFLDKASNHKNSDDLYYAFLLGFSFKAFNSSYVELLNKLIVEDWHNKHEDIADLLKVLKSPKSIEALYQTALKKFEYLSYDNSVPLASKCAYALFFIHTAEAKEKLHLLSKTAEHEEVREDASNLSRKLELELKRIVEMPPV